MTHPAATLTAGVQNVGADELGVAERLATLLQSGWGAAALFFLSGYGAAVYLFRELRRQQDEHNQDLRDAAKAALATRPVLDRATEVMEQIATKANDGRRR